MNWRIAAMTVCGISAFMLCAFSEQLYRGLLQIIQGGLAK